MATPSSGAIVGAQKLQQIIHLIEYEWAFGKGDRAAWRKTFKKKVLPRYERFLKKAARKEARKISKRMSKGVFIGHGGMGKGVESRSIHVKGEGAKYAKIFEHGGAIRAKNAENLTQPLSFAQKKDGSKKKSLRQYSDARTFTIVPKSMGKLTGQKVVFFKQGGREVVSRTGKKYIKNPSSIRPLFKLVPTMQIRPRYWATNAVAQARSQIHPYIQTAMDRFFSRKRR